MPQWEGSNITGPTEGSNGGGGGEDIVPVLPKDDPRISEYTGPQGNIRVVEDYTGQGGYQYQTVIGNVSGTPTPGYSGSGFQKMAGTTLRQPSAHADILASSQKSPALAGTLEKAGIIRIQNIPVQPQQAIMPASIQQVSNFRDSLQVSPTPSITEMRGRHDIEVGKLNTRQGEMRVGDIRSTRMFPVKQRMDNATMYIDDKISAWQGRAPEDVPYSVFGRDVAGGLVKGVAAVPGMAVDVVTGVEMIARDPSASLSGVPAGLGLMVDGIVGGLKENPAQTVSQLASTALVLGAGVKVVSKVSPKNIKAGIDYTINELPPKIKSILADEAIIFKRVLNDESAQVSLLQSLKWKRAAAEKKVAEGYHLSKSSVVKYDAQIKKIESSGLVSENAPTIEAIMRAPIKESSISKASKVRFQKKQQEFVSSETKGEISSSEGMVTVLKQKTKTETILKPQQTVSVLKTSAEKYRYKGKTQFDAMQAKILSEHMSVMELRALAIKLNVKTKTNLKPQQTVSVLENSMAAALIMGAEITQVQSQQVTQIQAGLQIQQTRQDQASLLGLASVQSTSQITPDIPKMPWIPKTPQVTKEPQKLKEILPSGGGFIPKIIIPPRPQSTIKLQQTRQDQASLLGLASVQSTSQITPDIPKMPWIPKTPRITKEPQKPKEIAPSGGGFTPKIIIPTRLQSTPPPRQNKRRVKQVSTDYRRSEREAPLLNPKKLLGGTGNTKLCELMGTCAPKRKPPTKKKTTPKRRKGKK